MSQAALILIKPDGLKKSLTGNILTRLSETKLEIVAAKMVRVSEALAKEHYVHLQDKPFFDELLKYLQGELHDRKKVMALVYWGNDAIKKCREGDTTTVFIKGDACLGLPEKVSMQRILGKVAVIERNGRTRQIDTISYRMIGLMFAVISPIRWFIYSRGSRVKRVGGRILGFSRYRSPE